MALFIEKTKLLLTTGNVALRLAIIGGLLALPSLWVGFFLDDYAHRSYFEGVGQLVQNMPSPVHLFTFLDGNPQHTHQLMESGFAPWWTSDTVLLNFWRPLASLTHVLDYSLWPNTPFLMHLQNLLWFTLTIFVVSTLYKRIGMPLWSAGLAGLLFVLDDAHGMPVAWIANRNAILGLFFGMLCLLSHMKWREQMSPRWSIAAIIGLVASIHSNEGGVATLGYLFSYALILDNASIRSRVVSLLPYVLVIILWRIYYSSMGFGASGSPMYIDPGAEPLRFVEQLLWRIPALLSVQLMNLPMESYELLPFPAKLIVCLFVTVIVAAFALLIWPLIRQSARARFWTLGMLISTIPAASTFTSGRMLMFVSVGGAALFAEYIIWVRDSLAERGRINQFVCNNMIILHLLVAPIIFLSISFGLGVASYGTHAMNKAIEYPEDIADRIVYVINAPNHFLTAQVSDQRILDGQSVAKAVYVLSPNAPLGTQLKVTRHDEDTLHVTPVGGFSYLLFRDTSDPFRKGERIELSNLSVEILVVDNQGRALEVLYHFPAPLESSRFFWQELKFPNGYRQYTLPKLGESHIL